MLHRDRLSIPVPRQEARGLQDFLRRHGIDSTVCWEPYHPAARLELPLRPGAADLAMAPDAGWNPAKTK